MSENLEILKNKLNSLKPQWDNLLKEKTTLLENSPEVKRYRRICYLQEKLEQEALVLKEKIKYEAMLECHHAFVNIDNKGNQYCIKCGLSTELTKSAEECLKNRSIYEKTIDNSGIINIDYVCKTEVAKAIYDHIVYKYPSISDEELVHFVAVAIHNMQTKKKSEKVKRDRAKRLYLRPSFLEKSNML